MSVGSAIAMLVVVGGLTAGAIALFVPALIDDYQRRRKP